MPATNRDEVCLCAICRNMIYAEQPKADCKVFDSDGELNYIELAHRECAINSEDDRWEHGPITEGFDHLERDHDEPYEPDNGE